MYYDNHDWDTSHGVNYIAEALYFELGGDADDENQEWYRATASGLYDYAETLYAAETRDRIRACDAARAAFLNERVPTMTELRAAVRS